MPSDWVWKPSQSAGGTERESVHARQDPRILYFPRRPLQAQTLLATDLWDHAVRAGGKQRRGRARDGGTAERVAARRPIAARRRQREDVVQPVHESCSEVVALVSTHARSGAAPHTHDPHTAACSRMDTWGVRMEA